MKHISPVQTHEFCMRAEAHYSGEMPYHNWEHARDVMANAVTLGRMAQSNGLLVDIDRLQVAAAWHDAGYHQDHALLGYSTKEAYSANLADENLPELAPDDIDIIHGSIMDTIVGGHRRRTQTEGILLHFADVGYLADPNQAHFTRRFEAMLNEWAGVHWNEANMRTRAFSEAVAEEAKHELTGPLTETQVDEWIATMRANVASLGKTGARK